MNEELREISNKLRRLGSSMQAVFADMANEVDALVAVMETPPAKVDETVETLPYVAPIEPVTIEPTAEVVGPDATLDVPPIAELHAEAAQDEPIKADPTTLQVADDEHGHVDVATAPAEPTSTVETAMARATDLAQPIEVVDPPAMPPQAVEAISKLDEVHTMLEEMRQKIWPYPVPKSK